MTKDKKIFGAPIDADENIQENKNDDGSAEITEQSGEDLIATLTAEAKQKSKSRKKKKIEEYKAIRATKDAIFSRLGRTIDVPIIMDNDEIMVFKVKRLSEAENSDIIDRSLAIKNAQDMTAEELEESTRYNYRLLEAVVVDPYLTQYEWEHNVDTALVQKLLEQITKVLTNIDDSEIFNEFH